jgi:hypothetical protein
MFSGRPATDAFFFLGETRAWRSVLGQGNCLSFAGTTGIFSRIDFVKSRLLVVQVQNL